MKGRGRGNEREGGGVRVTGAVEWSTGNGIKGHGIKQLYGS